jgi:ribulose-phosphate 3-epimerase
MDGHFVPNLTIGPFIVRAMRQHTRLPLDVHLMLEEADLYIPAFAEAGADQITVHVEACPHLHRTLTLIREEGARLGRPLAAGVAVNPATPLRAIEDALPFVDLVLLMSVNPGFGGQKFIPEVVPKLRRLRQEISERGLDVRIEMDGGLGPGNAAALVEEGLDLVVAGSAVFDGKDPAARCAEMLAALARGTAARRPVTGS